MTTTPPEAPSGSPDPSAGPPTEPPPGPRVTREEAKDLGRIRRSLVDRKLAGVAGGVARHFDIDPLLVRVGFVLLALFGGGGLLLYAAAWLLIPEQGTDDGVIRSHPRTRTVILTVVAGIAALSLVGDSFGGWEFPWPLAVIGLVIAAVAAGGRRKPHPGPLPGGPPAAGASYAGYQPGPEPQPADRRRRGPVLFWFAMGLAVVAVASVATIDLAGWDAPGSAYPAAVLAVCAAMLLVGAFFGRAGGLIVVGLLAALATLAATAVEDISAGQIETQPARAADVDETYRLGAGEVILDLTEVSDLDELDGRTIEADVRFGRVVVLVPAEGLDVTADADIQGGGESVLFGDRTDGSLTRSHDGGADAGTPSLDLELDVLFGQIEVETEEAAR